MQKLFDKDKYRNHTKHHYSSEKAPKETIMAQKDYRKASRILFYKGMPDEHHKTVNLEQRPRNVECK